MRKETVKYDCKHFEGHIPCNPNKQHDVQCDDCSHYDASALAITFLELKNHYFDCYLGNSCKREKSCMYDISVQDVLSNIAVLNKNLKE